jgi:uncharacterized protein (UPF0179 family)
MAEIGQLCKIELDENTIYKIVDVRTKKLNIVTDEAQTTTTNTVVDVVEVENSKIKKINIPIYDIHIIQDDNE